MRIRSIKPEFWRSDDITALPREVRLLFIGLWSYVDDNGVGVDDYRAIAADLFALEDDQKEVRDFVRDGLATLSRALLVARYEVDGRSYLFITGWDRHQRIDRPSKARYPRPPEDWTPPTSDDGNPRESVARDSRQSPDSLDAGTGEQGNRGERTSSLAALAETDRFADFWGAYPRRVEKRAAEKSWRAALKRKTPPEQIISAAKAYADRTRDTEPRFIKHPASWLNAGAYDDETATPARPQLASFDDFRAQGAAAEAARLLGIACILREQPPSDPTPPGEWIRRARVEWVDAHEQEIRVALTDRKTG